MSKPRETKGPANSARGVTSDLASRIASAKRDRAIEANRASVDNSKDMTGLARGMRIGTEFIAAILIGAGIGYIFDRAFGTGPWAMLIMVLVGFAAGILNVIRVVTDMNAASPPPPGSDLGPLDESDEDKDR